MNRSERGIALVYQGKPDPKDRQILTVESYIKWYHIYSVHSDGRIFIINRGYADKYESETNDVAWSDHFINPFFARWLDEQPEFEWDSPSFDMVVGRWLRAREE